MDKDKPVTDEYLSKSKFYKGKPHEEKDIENRIANLRLYHSGLGTPCGIVSFGVKKNVSYGGHKLYWMLKDKIINGNRITIYQNPNYTSEQKQKNEI